MNQEEIRSRIVEITHWLPESAGTAQLVEFVEELLDDMQCQLCGSVWIGRMS